MEKYISNTNLASQLANKFFAQELFYLTKIGGSDYVPNGDHDTIYFHDPKDTLENWRPLHDIAAKVSTHPIDQSGIIN